MAKSNYSSRMRNLGLLALLGAIATGLAGGQVLRWGGASGWSFWLLFPVLLAVCAFAFIACVPWWRALDPMQKEGHLVSWYWGGIGGAAAVLMALIAASGSTSPLTRGALYLFLGQGAAFAVYWLGWQWSHRGAQA